MAEVKDLENVEQEATAPAMEETAAEKSLQPVLLKRLQKIKSPIQECILKISLRLIKSRKA